MQGKLTIVPTPIGNVADMSPRALEILRAADTVCAEDTRVTGKLLTVLGIKDKRFERLDENVMSGRASHIIQRVQQGEHIAFCSDAGMPGVSDPGLRLVAAAHEAGVPVEVLPGPSAVVTAYVASGTTSPTFYFGGFFPRKDKARADLLENLRSLDAALIFYESPNRLVGALKIISAFYPARKVAVCRELTKLHEEVVRNSASQLVADFVERRSIKGEIVIVIDPPANDEAALNVADVNKRARELSDAGERPKTIAKQLSAEFGVPRNVAYDTILALK